MSCSKTFSLVALLGLSMSSLSSAAYVIQDTYSPSNFFSMFNFYTGSDPTSGYVNYVSQSTAQSQGLITSSSSSVYMGVDYTNVASGSGRGSVRLESKKQYTHGLFILDLNHMPANACGAWPAFWTYGPNWPNNGEIDILEGVNSQNVNFMTLHTSNGCTMTNGGYSGQQATTQCAVDSANTGCSIHDTRTTSFGNGFNNNGGGIFAAQWTSNGINIWFFARNAIPGDITNGRPKPSGWGTPAAAFNGGSNCNIDQHFASHYIVFDTTFCGAWAGNQGVWNADSTCASKASTCQAYVQNNPSAFKNVYWSINSLKVYQDNGSGGTKREEPVSNPAFSPRHVDAIESLADVSSPHTFIAARDSSIALAQESAKQGKKIPFLGLSPNDPGNGTFDATTHRMNLMCGCNTPNHVAGRHVAALLSDHSLDARSGAAADCVC